MSTGNHGSVSSERAIENLISSYAFLNDDADIAGLGELFADAVCTLDETTARGFHVITWASGGFGMALVSDIGWDDLRLLEALLFAAIPRVDVKPLAKALLAEFGGLGPLLAASPDNRVRDGRRAMALVNELRKTHQTIDLGETLAMTLAELGQYEQAAAMQRDVMAAARARS